MNRGKYLSLEEAQKKGKLKEFAKDTLSRVKNGSLTGF